MEAQSRARARRYKVAESFNMCMRGSRRRRGELRVVCLVAIAAQYIHYGRVAGTSRLMRTGDVSCELLMGANGRPPVDVSYSSTFARSAWMGFAMCSQGSFIPETNTLVPDWVHRRIPTLVVVVSKLSMRSGAYTYLA